MSERPSVWRPYLPEPQPACVDEGEPDSVPLEVLRDLRTVCADFRIPRRQFRRRTPGRCTGYYSPASDIVVVNPYWAAMDGMGGDDGYYATLLHELLHATGHPKRLGRATVGDYSDTGYEAEERTVITAQRTVLKELGFGMETLDWYAPQPPVRGRPD